MAGNNKEISLIKLWHILGIVCFIALIVFVYIVPFQKPKPPKQLTEKEILLAIDQCKKMAKDVNVSHQFQRQLNTLNCFKNLASKNIDYNYCLNLEKDYQTNCLVAFAQIKSDLTICQQGTTEIIISNCQKLAAD